MHAEQTDGQRFPTSVELNLRTALESPGTKRTRVPSIAGIHCRFPVQTIGTGISANPSLSGESRRLYIGSITPDVSEHNPTGFFSGQMVKMDIGADGPSKYALAVQCNYERNYALVEVGVHCCGSGYSGTHILLYFPIH